MPFRLDVRFVRVAEQKLGRTLPPDYSARMCRDNGGHLSIGQDSFELYPILDTSDRKRLARTCNDIIRETVAARSWIGFPPEALAIGDNGGGDKLVLLPDADAPQYAEDVYWWDHETGQVHLVAESMATLTS